MSTMLVITARHGPTHHSRRTRHAMSHSRLTSFKALEFYSGIGPSLIFHFPATERRNLIQLKKAGCTWPSAGASLAPTPPLLERSIGTRPLVLSTKRIMVLVSYKWYVKISLRSGIFTFCRSTSELSQQTRSSHLTPTSGSCPLHASHTRYSTQMPRDLPIPVRSHSCV